MSLVSVGEMKHMTPPPTFSAAFSAIVLFVIVSPDGPMPSLASIPPPRLEATFPAISTP